MKLDKKPSRRALKTPTLTPQPSVAAPTPVLAAKPKRIAKTAAAARPTSLPKAAVSTKPKRTPRAATQAQPPGISKPDLATKSKRPVRHPRPAAATVMKSKRPVAPRPIRQPKLEIPPILLAGDAPSRPSASGPGQRYALGPGGPPPANWAETGGDLPESYGTAKLWLTARDPHWLYAYWDLSSEQLRRYNTESDDGHLIVRVFEKEFLGEALITQHVHPESRNWFVHVPRAGAKYVAQLGYFDRQERWQTVALSPATITPPDSLSDDTSADFATLPVEVPFEQLVEMVKTVISQNVPLMEALAQLRAEGHENLPTADTFAPPPRAALAAPKSRSAATSTKRAAPVEIAGPAPAPTWTPAQAQALAEVITMDEVRRVWIGSLEITELIRRSMMKELTDQTAAQLATGQGALGQGGPGLGSPSSPFGALSSFAGAIGGAGGQHGFWFNINAELIIYGATEPDAAVTIGGRKIRLRPDGTFSYRFALPDGKYDLPAVAVSAAGDDQRSAALHFQRQTHYSGDVGTHPQDTSLRPPKPEHVA